MTSIPSDELERAPTYRQMLRPFWFVGALLMMLDALTTYIALTYYSRLRPGAREGNPIGVWAIEHLGVAGMCIAKTLIGVAMMWRLAATAERGHRLAFLNRSLLFRQATVVEGPPQCGLDAGVQSGSHGRRRREQRAGDHQPVHAVTATDLGVLAIGAEQVRIGW